MDEEDNEIEKKMVEPIKRIVVSEKRQYIDALRSSKSPKSPPTIISNPTKNDLLLDKKRKVDREDYKPVVVLLTKRIIDTYKKCRPGNFHYHKALQNPRRILTKDSHAGGNFGFDNKEGDMIMGVGETILNPITGQRYKIIDMLGQGTFGQVVKCRTLTQSELSKTILNDTNHSHHHNPSSSDHVSTTEIPSMVAIKVVKNRPAYTNQAKVEIKILEKLVRAYEKSDPETRHYHHHVLHILDSFQYHSHVCMVFELMSINLFELIKQNDFRGLAIREISSFASQILAALKVLDELQIIHCDIKPENILIENFSNPPRIKLVDFGSACFENHTMYSYIQSRFYRAPEVIIGMCYSKKIDIWSFGCIMVELFMGLPVFPGASNHNQLLRIEETLGEFPEWMLERGRQVSKFYTRASVEVQDDEGDDDSLPKEKLDRNRNESELYEEDIYEQDENLDALLDSPATRPSGQRKEKRYQTKWVIKSAEDYAFDENLPATEKMKRYCKEIKLVDIILKCDSKRRPNGESVSEMDRNVLKSFFSFVRSLLKLDPNERISVDDAIQHPFISSPTMTEQSPTRRLSSFVMPSPAVTPSLVSPGSFYNTPFSPPIRPGVPYPLAHDWVNSDPQTPSYNPFCKDFEDPKMSSDVSDNSKDDGIKFLMGESAYFNSQQQHHHHSKAIGIERHKSHSEALQDIVEDKPLFYDSPEVNWDINSNMNIRKPISSSLPMIANFDKSASSSLESAKSSILPLLHASSYHEENDMAAALLPLPPPIRGSSLNDADGNNRSRSLALMQNGFGSLSNGQSTQLQNRILAPAPSANGKTTAPVFSTLSDANLRAPRLSSDSKFISRVFSSSSNNSSSIEGASDAQPGALNENAEGSKDSNAAYELSSSAPRFSFGLGSPYITGTSPRTGLSEIYLTKQFSPRRRRSAFSRVIPNGSGGCFSPTSLCSPLESRSKQRASQSLSPTFTLPAQVPNISVSAKKALYSEVASHRPEPAHIPTSLDLNQNNYLGASQPQYIVQ